MIKSARILFAVVVLAAGTFQSCKKHPEGKSDITFSKTEFSVTAAKQTVSFILTSTAGWTIEPDDNWISATPDSGGAGSTTVTVNIDANSEAKSRNGSLTVSAPDISKTYLLFVTQAAHTGDGGDYASASAEIKWIYDMLGDYYYWNEAIKTAKPKYSLPYNYFLKDLLVNLTGAVDPDGTMDGGYYYNGDRYVYSYILSDNNTRANGKEQTFGFDFQYFWTDETDTELCLVVTWVLPGGPADLKGMKRGTRIVKYQNAAITEDSYYDFVYQLDEMKGGTHMELTLSDGTEVSLDAVTMEVSPVIYPDLTKPIGAGNGVFTVGGKKVGYMVYNQFEIGPSLGGGKYKFDNQMRDVFAAFKAAGITELVLDLRYNPGGYVDSSQILASLISGAPTTKVFAKLQYNKSRTTNNPETWTYRGTTLEPNSLTNLNRVFVLAKANTASASEMIISSLRGIWDPNPGMVSGSKVIHIGETTEGKNVGMTKMTKTINGFYYEMWPITFKIYNSQDFADYANGFTPNYKINEFREITEPGKRNVIAQGGSGVIYQLGDPQEELLKAALTLIDGGTPDTDTRSKTAGQQKTLEPVRQFRGGAKIIPDEKEGM